MSGRGYQGRDWSRLLPDLLSLISGDRGLYCLPLRLQTLAIRSHPFRSSPTTPESTVRRFLSVSTGECVECLAVVGPREFVYSTVPTEATSPRFMYWRAQDRAWIKTNPVSEYPIITVSYHCNKFYIIHENGDLAICDVGWEGKLVLVPSLKFCCFKLEQGRWLRIQGMGDYTVFTRITKSLSTRNTECTIIAPAGFGSA